MKVNEEQAKTIKLIQLIFLQRKQKKNEGELPQVYVENALDAIIDKKAFDLVQIETERRMGIKHYCGICQVKGKMIILTKFD